MLLRFALVLSQVTSAAPASTPREAPEPPAPAQAAGPPASESTRAEEAKALYASQRFVEAAHAYEELFAETRAAKFLFNAAAAREAAGHDAHAYVLLRRYLDTPGLSAEEQARGEARLAPLRRRATALQIRTTPAPRPAGFVLSLVRRGHEPLRLDEEAVNALDKRGIVELWAEVGDWSIEASAPGHRPTTLSVTATEGAAKSLDLHLASEATKTPPTVARGVLRLRLEPTRAASRRPQLLIRRGDEVLRETLSLPESIRELPVGSWTLSAKSNGFASTPQTVQIVRGLEQEVSLRLKRTPASKLRLGLALGTASLSLVSLGIGAGLARHGEQEYDRADLRTEAGRNRGTIGLDYVLAGNILLGASAGLAAISVTSALDPERDWPFFTELGLGSVAMISGAAWLHSVMPGYEVPGGGREALYGIRRLEMGSSLLVGLGAGLVGGAISALIGRAAMRRQGQLRVKKISSAAISSRMHISKGRFSSN